MSRAVRAPALLMASLALAGCLGDGGGKPRDADLDDAPSGSLEQQVLDPPPAAEGGLQQSQAGVAQAAPGNGEIRGLVYDVGEVPVAGAVVALLGTEATATSGPEGAFRFVNVSAGRHTLRVDAADYVAHEGAVDVVPGRVTEVLVRVAYPPGQDAGSRPHLHDYWGTDTTITLVDAAIVVDALVVGANSQLAWDVPIPDDRTDGRPALVFPATANVTVTVAWDAQDIMLPAVGVRWRTAANDTQYESPLQPPGQPFTIPVLPVEADNGHQLFSLWTFQIYSGSRQHPSSHTPGLADGEFNVRIDVAKGQLLADPPHPDHWGTNDTLVVRGWGKVTGMLVAAPEACPTAHRFAMDEDAIVPPGTLTLAIRFHWQPATLPSGHPGERAWTLLAKPADLPPDAPLSSYTPLQPSGGQGTDLQYAVPLSQAQADAFYQSKSNWLFAAVTADAALESCATSDAGLALNLGGLAPLFTRFQLEVVAQKAM